jgi:hypothetical protein
MILSNLTTWRTIYLSTSKHPKMLQSGLRPCLHRSGPQGLINHPPHVSPSSDDGGSAICGGDFTKRQSQTGEGLASCVESSENDRPQSSITHTPKWSVQSGKTITSCSKAPEQEQGATIFIHNETKLCHSLANNLPFHIKTSEDAPIRSASMLTPKWSARPDKLPTSCFTII